MIIRVSASTLEGSVAAPGSKSLMQRAVVAAMLGRGTSIIHRPADNADCAAALECAALLGAEISLDDKGSLHITGGKQAPDHLLNVGESGLSMRLFTALGAMSGYDVELTGEGSLLKRPLTAFEQVFPQLGARIETNAGFLPCRVKGPFKGGEATLDGSISSQFLSGLLMALPLADEDSVLHVSDLKSTPYIDMTLEVMERFGVVVTHKNYEDFYIRGKQHYKPAEITIEGDWSSAAAMLVAGAVSARQGVQVSNLKSSFTQADSSVIGALLFAGARIANNDGSYDFAMSKIRGIEVNLVDSPDLFPVLAALASAGKKPSVFHGVHRLTHKESNRGLVIQREFAKASIRVDIEGDRMVVHPGAVQACDIDASNDHRIVMAAAILGLRGGPVTIHGAEAVVKSYPDFFDDLDQLGAKTEIMKEN